MGKKISLASLLAVLAFLAGTFSFQNTQPTIVNAAQSCTVTDSRGSQNSSAYGWTGTGFPIKPGCYAVAYYCPNRTALTNEGCEENARVIREGSSCLDLNLPGVQQCDLFCVDSDGELIPAGPDRKYSAFQSVAISCQTIPDAPVITPAPTAMPGCNENYCNPGGPWAGKCCNQVNWALGCEHTWEEGFYAACYPSTPQPTQAPTISPTSTPISVVTPMPITPSPVAIIVPTFTPVVSSLPVPTPVPSMSASPSPLANIMPIQPIITPIPVEMPTPSPFPVSTSTPTSDSTPVPLALIGPTPSPQPTNQGTNNENERSIGGQVANPTPVSVILASNSSQSTEKTTNNIINNANTNLSIDNNTYPDVRLALNTEVLAAEDTELGNELAETGVFVDNVISSVLLSSGGLAVALGVRIRSKSSLI